MSVSSVDLSAMMTSKRSTVTNATATTAAAAAAAASTGHLERLFGNSIAITDPQTSETLQDAPLNSITPSVFST